MNEDQDKTEGPKKAWVVKQKVHAAELEDLLNEAARSGYQAYRIDRFTTEEPHLANAVVKYDVILFNPVIIGEYNAVGMASMLQKAQEAAAAVAGGKSGVT